MAVVVPSQTFVDIRNTVDSSYHDAFFLFFLLFDNPVLITLYDKTWHNRTFYLIFCNRATGNFEKKQKIVKSSCLTWEANLDVLEFDKESTAQVFENVPVWHAR